MKHFQNSDDRTKTLEKENNDLKCLLQRVHKEHKQSQTSVGEERDELRQMTSDLTTRVLRANERTRKVEKERDEAIDMMIHALFRVDTAEYQRDSLLKKLSQMQRNLHRRTNELDVLKRLCNKLKATPIPIDTPILVMKKKWIKMFREHEKKLEIRSHACVKEIGTPIFLAPSGCDELTDRVEFGGSQTINSERKWRDLRGEHRNPHPQRRYGENTHAWKLNNCTNLTTPIPHKVYPGTVIWRKYFPPY